MDSSICKNKKGPIVDPGACRCCGATKKCRVLNVEYEFMNKKEVYTDLFVECFGLMLSHLEGEMKDRLICATCVTRLREAHMFRHQVLQCEQKLLHAEITLHEEVTPIVITEVIDETQKSKCIVISDNTISDLLENITPIGIADVIDETQKSECILISDDTTNDVVENDMSTVKKAAKPNKTGEITRFRKRLTLRKEEQLRAKRQLWVRMQKMRARLKRVQSTGVRPNSQQNRQILKKDAKPLQRPPKEPPMKIIDEDAQIYHNDCTIIENSYVVPFRTSYSSYSCVYCQKNFISPRLLREHSMKHDQNKFRHLAISKRPTYMDVSKIDCRLCDLNVNDITTLKDHITTVHEKVMHSVESAMLQFQLVDGTLSCIVCDKKFIFFHALKRHMAEHYGNVICDICGAHYFDQHALNIHSRYFHRNKDKYSCQDCGKLFALKHNLYAHMSTIHRTDAAYPCNRCDQNFFSMKERSEHLAQMHGETKEFKCDYCGKLCKDMRNLRQHIWSVHFKMYKLKCGICDRGFMAASKLNEHVMTAHKDDNLLFCNICGKNYPKLHYLKLHMQFHKSVDV